MSKRNPLRQNQFIKDEFNAYIRSTFQLKDQVFRKNFIDQLERFDLTNGPFLSFNLPFVANDTISDLIHKGLLDDEMKRMFKEGEMDTFKLYDHQVQAIKQVQAKNNLVITTGTGSGKTEAFLYPILNEIIKEIKAGNKTKGIRAFFLYPLNALINDQMNRLREILKFYPEITFGFFTGETKNKNGKITFQSEPEDLQLPNEIKTREQLRESPPHILFTNFSMLEYLLIRPTDDALLKQEAMSNWRFMVLDEAHTYRGSLAIEISLLIKRLVINANKHPQFILTSATLGRGRQDLEKIINFAETLTQSKFFEENIVFASRVPLKLTDAATVLNSATYSKLILSLDHLQTFNTLTECKLSDLKDIPQQLGQFLLKDKTFGILLNTIEKPILFTDLLKKIQKIKPTTHEELVDFIELIAKARYENTFLLDIKYHMFLRAPEGAFITLNESKHFRLINTKWIDGYKAFNIGICEYCKSSYIFGKIEDNILQQAEDVDIEDNLEEEEKNHLDFFIYPDGLTEAEVDRIKGEPEVTVYQLCNRCGNIRDPKQINSEVCDCQDCQRKEIYQIPSTHQVTHCYVCDNQKNTGLIKSFHIGKDSATALIAQILYQSFDVDEIPKIEITSPQVMSDSLFKAPVKRVKIEKPFKQFLAFSDSRQQASFFAKFYDYNDDRFLKKASLLNVIKNKKQKSLSMDELYTEIFALYTNKQMYKDETRNEVFLTILLELLLVDGAKSASKTGLYDFVLKLPSVIQQAEFLNHFKTKHKIDLSSEDWGTLIRLGLEVFRITPAISYPELTCDDSRRSDVLGYRRFMNQVALILPPNVDAKAKRGIRSFMPISHKNDYFVFFQKVLSISDSTAKEVWEDLWNMLGNPILGDEKILEIKPDSLNATIPYQKYQLMNGENIQWFQCNKCAHLTHYNFKDFCPSGDCHGQLILVDPKILYQDEYYQRQYRLRKIERTMIREHTAQLSPKQAREYQQDFMNKRINILSSSTTFEMGINLGSLSTVFLRNMPPFPSNYVQRAGRAGRSINTPSMIVTFCNNTSHDFTFYKDPIPMISGHIVPPYFTLGNQKIVLRHIMAFLLGKFFKLHPNLIESMGDFIDSSGELLFDEFLKTLPDSMLTTIDHELIPVELQNQLGKQQWLTHIRNESANLLTMMKELKDRIKFFEQELNNKTKANDFGTHAKYNMNLIRNEINVIAHLSSFNVIPRYGFPIDNVDLKIYNPNLGRQSDQYRLTRDLSVAISEFAPDSQIIVDKNMYTSRYIILPPEKELPTQYYAICPHCLHMNLSSTSPKALENCVYCGQSTTPKNGIIPQNKFVIPRYGFYTDYKETTSRTIKPKKSYSGDISYVGQGNLINPIEIVSPKITISKFKNSKLMIVNESGFYMCRSCGYTKLIKSSFIPFTNNPADSHTTYQGKKCLNQRLERVTLGHEFATDVGVIEAKVSMTYEQAISTLYALLEGVSLAAQIERKDINGVLTKNKDFYQFVLYDNVPGGAGHTSRLSSRDHLKQVFQKAWETVDSNCCAEETSCYACLRNYGNQKKHKDLSRQGAKFVLSQLLEF
jgi:ATP-dependent helicase YprA (DUF1998 family)